MHITQIRVVQKVPLNKLDLRILIEGISIYRKRSARNCNTKGTTYISQLKIGNFRILDIMGNEELENKSTKITNPNTKVPKNLINWVRIS